MDLCSSNPSSSRPHCDCRARTSAVPSLAGQTSHSHRPSYSSPPFLWIYVHSLCLGLFVCFCFVLLLEVIASGWRHKLLNVSVCCTLCSFSTIKAFVILMKKGPSEGRGCLESVTQVAQCCLQRRHALPWPGHCGPNTSALTNGIRPILGF